LGVAAVCVGVVGGLFSSLAFDTQVAEGKDRMMRPGQEEGGGKVK
jgi:excinuclease UvrABC ATPase subunit